MFVFEEKRQRTHPVYFPMGRGPEDAGRLWVREKMLHVTSARGSNRVLRCGRRAVEMKEMNHVAPSHGTAPARASTLMGTMLLKVRHGEKRP